MTISTIKTRWDAFLISGRGRMVVKVGQAGFLAGVLALLAYQLSGIGWTGLWQSMPREPLFYMFLLVMYFLLPVSEAVIYNRLWHIHLGSSLLVLLQKRVLNTDVLGYSGEVYLYMWVKDRVSLTRSQIKASIKDNVVVSALVSVSTVVLLAAVLLAAGQISIGDFAPQHGSLYAATGGFLAVTAIALTVRFRRSIFFLPEHLLGMIAGIHLSRFLIGYVLQVLQWWVVMPDAPFRAWAVLLVVLAIIGRIPFLPSRDLVFASMGGALSPLLDIPVAAVMGMLLVRSVIDRVLNLAFFGLGTLLVRKQPQTESPDYLSERGDEPSPKQKVPVKTL